jgi:positive regulator of sigma E activity
MILYDMSISVPMRISFILLGTIIAFIVNRGFYNKFINKKEYVNYLLRMS